MHFFESSSFCSFVYACGIENESVASYDVHIDNSVKVAGQKGKWFNLAFLYHNPDQLVGIILTSPIVSGNAQGPFFT